MVLGMRVLALSLVLGSICASNAASHSLKYFYTAVTAGVDFPEFTIVGLVDDEQFVHYDSNIRRMIPKTEWINKNERADYWDRESQKQTGPQQTFKANIGILMQRFNQTQGVHTFQWMFGCEWDDETGATGGFSQYGYDGEDFITYDLENQRCVALAQSGFSIAQKKNNDPARLEHWKYCLTQECVDGLKKYVSYGRSALERTVAPKVSLLQKDSPSPGLTCHVTGFYPRGFMVTWQRNGEDLHEDVELGETVPNGDGTFQTRSHLTVKPEDWKSQEYTCTVQHKSLEQDIVLSVNEENIKRNSDIKNDSSPPMGVIIGCVVGALILILAVIGVVIWKKRSSSYKTTNT
ncbi:popy class I histocompatibility antigen, alpha chain E-like isoform X2 [Anguilla anguilla]|uniref:popy class I histocompatibility antigen, alpha chain E-like isoform X2 n=1 Tax=Anguilla anguilla TaxID=7936 RepID=UPI0015AF0B40|nr:popy class I histocompatibility antigen, alpha chain E-like isoform X2 [Anguilla anguilla]